MPRKPGPLALLSLLLLLVLGISVRLALSARTARHATTPRVALAASAPGNQPVPAAQPDAPYLYTAAVAEPVERVVRRLWPHTSYMTRAELEVAVRAANHLRGRDLKPRQQIVVPGYEAGPIVERPIGAPAGFEVRALYLTGTMAGSVAGLRLAERWKEAGGNAVVFDIKDSDGSVSVPFAHPWAPASAAIPNPPKYVRHLHSLGLYVIARIALFRDERLARAHPELAPQSRRNKQAWLENGELAWLDASRHDVQDYNLALARKVAGFGVDEIQFDYVRFPAEGEQKDAQFAFLAEQPQRTRADVITDFVSRAYKELHGIGVPVSLDVFGITAWQRPVDLGLTGQDITRLQHHCDVLAPMIYPSHFFDMDGYARPGDAPEHFIGESMDRFVKITAESKVLLRPWLQAFAWRTPSYSADYIVGQVRTAKDKGGVGFMFWNARNDYSKPLTAMPQMRTAGGYFRGDQVATVMTEAPSPH